MGYTHYWSYKATPGQEYDKALAQIRKLLDTEPVMEIGLRGELEDEPPIFTPQEIWFNGAGKDNCESFGFYVLEEEADWCKTDRKPYDLVVMLCLLALANNLEGFSFSSDGSLSNEWKPAVDLYQKEIDVLKPRVLAGLRP